MRAVPLTRDQANAYIVAHHRHHGRVTGHRFIVGAADGDRLVGVAVVGRPRARLLDQANEAEVTRLCTDGSKNVCSFLYSRCSRVARELGFAKLYTYTLESEPGGSLRASGWIMEKRVRGESQDRPSRRRVDKSPTAPKLRWCPAWCAPGAPL